MGVSFLPKKLYSVGFFILLMCHNLYASDTIDKQAMISVSGSHSVTVTHDQATIRGSVITTNIKAQTAVQDNANIIENLRKTLEKAKIDPKKLISHNYQLTSNYDYKDGQQIFRNYQVTHDISVTTNNINQIGTIADLLTSAGTNQISRIEFTSSQTSKAYNDALKNAVLDAKNKAQLAISGIHNLSVGKAINIHINPDNSPVKPVIYEAMASSDMLSKNAPTSFQTEGETITVDVQTTWEIINQ